MKNIKKHGKNILYFMISILIITIILSTIDYFTSITTNPLNILITISMIIMFFIIGVKTGKKVESKGYIQGLKKGSLLILLLYLLNIIFNGFTISLTRITYYLLLIISCTIGSMIGINKKTTNN